MGHGLPGPETNLQQCALLYTFHSSLWILFHFLLGGGVCLWGGGQIFWGWSKGGPKILASAISYNFLIKKCSAPLAQFLCEQTYTLIRGVVIGGLFPVFYSKKYAFSSFNQFSSFYRLQLKNTHFIGRVLVRNSSVSDVEGGDLTRLGTLPVLCPLKTYYR